MTKTVSNKIQINEKPSNEKNIKKAQKNDQGSNISMTNCISDDGMKKIDEEELMNKINSSKFEGDFDFVIPDITKEELKSVLKNKEIGPFLFYDNINEDSYEKFDIIGEVPLQLGGNLRTEVVLHKFALIQSEDGNQRLAVNIFHVIGERSKMDVTLEFLVKGLHGIVHTKRDIHIQRCQEL